ncbi:hypothetical protein Rhsp01_43150 [Rhizobium sp. NBRC 114257]|uniref:Uncharacterized protein n=1 Tax=Rhizobium dioscoreae TaxID=2653122 RepID=A0ABQ0Z9Z7_9HYPH|nr:hypothetical protein RsS93_47560 [Rhizobium dioscoreae]GLU83139.1 hypothetical protein Rhsp01_43150 [Rhizobium sp. NBRC 114257]
MIKPLPDIYRLQNELLMNRKKAPQEIVRPAAFLRQCLGLGLANGAAPCSCDYAPGLGHLL